MRAALLVGALSLGCARNAFLELEIDLPKNETTTTRFALVQVVSGDVPFDQAWAGGDPVPAVKLGAAPTPLKISVEGDSDTETRPIEVKVRFCKDASCTALGDDVAPEVRMHLERAFYIGERTSYTWSIACMPNVPGQTDPPPVCDTKQRAQNDVPKCKVAGCRSGVTSEYCSGGKHFCE